MQRNLPPALQAAAPEDDAAQFHAARITNEVAGVGAFAAGQPAPWRQNLFDQMQTAAANPETQIDAQPMAQTETVSQTRKQLRQDKELTDGLQIVVDEVRKDFDEVKAKNTALKERTKKLMELLAGGVSLKETLAAVQSKHATARGKVDSLTEEIAKNEETAGKLTAQSDNLKQRIAAVTVSTEGLAEQQKRLFAENARMKRQAHQQRRKFKEDAPKLMDKITAAKDNFTSLFDEVHNLEVAAANETAKRDEARAEYDRVKEQLDQAFQQSTQMNAQYDEAVQDSRMQQQLHKAYRKALGNVKSIVDLTIAGLNRVRSTAQRWSPAEDAAAETIGELTKELAAEVDFRDQMSAATAEVPAAAGGERPAPSPEELPSQAPVTGDPP